MSNRFRIHAHINYTSLSGKIYLWGWFTYCSMARQRLQGAQQNRLSLVGVSRYSDCNLLAPSEVMNCPCLLLIFMVELFM